ncbi:unnamed protein product [Lathyrus sativus]|nr:unnamed protein product [Lathyrus sativus]
MPVLVNGSPTKDFKVCIILRQGDPLSPFLFAILVEDLIVMLEKPVTIGAFKGFHVNYQRSYILMRFVDGTILLGEGSWPNLWTIKSILIGFEMASGLRLNLGKSKLYGIGLNDQFFLVSTLFQYCCIDKIPFRFLGILCDLAVNVMQVGDLW